jgi:PAS domain S-box-containing protein
MERPEARRFPWPGSVSAGIAEAAVVAALYFVTARLGLSLAFANKNVTAIWPPTGIAVAALILCGYRVWPGIALGALTANLANGAPVGVAFGFTVGNTLAPFVAAYLLRRISFHPRLDRVGDVVAFAGFGISSMLVSSTLGTSILAVSGGLGPNSYWSVWGTWWVGDGLGVLLFAPVLLVYLSTPLREVLAGTRRFEAAICLVSVGVAGYFVLTASIPVQYLVLPFVAWAALRFFQVGATAAILVVSSVSVWAAVHGLGPNPHDSQTLRLVTLDLFNGALAVSALLLAAVSIERAAVLRTLHESTALLEHQVGARTKELADANEELRSEVAVRATAEESLRRRTMEYESILQAMSDLGEGAVVVDMSTRRIRYANDAYCRITGYRLGELQQFGSYLDVLSPDARRSMGETSQRINSAGSTSAFGEASVLRKDGHEVPVDWASGRVRFGEAELSIGVIRDATERKRKLSLVEAARDAAQAASRAKGEYLSRLSHELRTPLTVIIGYSDLLSERELPPDERKHVEAILKSADHLLALVNDVLDIARIEAGRETLALAPLDAADVCQEAVRLMASVAHRNGATLTYEGDGPHMVNGDRQRLLQVLLNLISNGVKYGGGSVRVSVHLDGDTTRILVADNGPGLSSAEQVLLFQPFQRVGSGRGEGTGLGLALSKALVEGMGGTIGVDSDHDGTTFWVALSSIGEPAQRTQRRRRTPHDKQSSGVNGETRGLSVLHIEDDPAMVKLVDELCNARPDIQLQSVMMGRMGMELARASQPDVILLDLHLPDINGGEVLQTLKNDPVTRDIPVVVLSADATNERVQELMQLGAFKYLTKPIRAKSIVDTLDEVLSAAGAEGVR